MSEDEAKTLVAEIVGGGAMARLTELVAMVIAENEQQNLIARSTMPAIWTRHVLDSVQLLRHRQPGGAWLDIGTGGGFPGLAVAAVTCSATILVEPRRRRAAFLDKAARALQLHHAVVCHSKVEAVSVKAATISARAVASMEKLLQAAGHCATSETRWLFLRGRSTEQEIDALHRQTRIMFHVEQSLSDPASSIVIAEMPPR